MSKSRSSALKRDREQRKAEKLANKKRRREERQKTEDEVSTPVDSIHEETSDPVSNVGEPLALRTPGEPNTPSAQP